MTNEAERRLTRETEPDRWKIVRWKIVGMLLLAVVWLSNSILTIVDSQVAQHTQGVRNMAMWLYQLSQDAGTTNDTGGPTNDWPPNRYRLSVWENEPWRWRVGMKFGPEDPKPGDILAFYYARTTGNDGGFYGWAVVLEWSAAGKEPLVYFRPVAPSDHLKMHPWSDANANQVADEIREKQNQGTLWPVSQKLEQRLRRGITAWLCGESLDVAKVPV